ncbi:MAG: MBL fold metallo-hydrolase [Gemmatimonadales bacterium]|jgi:metallo-beta-lactamase family protein|nr:MBL fold metallo-hydrolase [Gemmatimonadales bacterium]
MTIRLSFFGAAGQVTGSMHLLEAAGARILLDAGMFQGRRAVAAKLNRELPFDPRRLDMVVLSHAHIDHTGRLPLLVREGFHGPIYATPATRDLAAVLLPDAAHIQQKDAEYLAKRGKVGPESEPLYGLADALAAQELMVGVPYHRPIHLRKFLSLEYRDAGHILGSATLDLRLTEGVNHRLVFSGDIGRRGLPIIRDPEPPAGPVDTLIIEATYADRTHESVGEAQANLGAVVRRVAARGGKVLVPSFAVGRAQELIYALHALWRAGEIPEIPIFVDSPLAVDATSVFRMHPDCFDAREKLVQDGYAIFDFPLVRYVRDVQASKQLNRLEGPAVIIAASGMVESGRVLHHLANLAGDHRNCMVFVSFQAQHTLGRRIQEGQERIRVFGEEIDRRCEVVTLGGYSAHADQQELRAWVRHLGGPIRRAFVVHGETPALKAMADLLREEGVREVHVPEIGDTYEL